MFGSCFPENRRYIENEATRKGKNLNFATTKNVQITKTLNITIMEKNITSQATKEATKATETAMSAQAIAEKAKVLKIIDRYNLKGKSYSGSVCATIRDITTDSQGKIGVDEIATLLKAIGVTPNSSTIRTQHSQARRDLGYKSASRQSVSYTFE